MLFKPESYRTIRARDIDRLQIRLGDLKPEKFARAGSSPAVLTKNLGGLTALLLLGACAATVPRIDSFGDFTPPAVPHYLACPQNYCLASPDEVTPLLPVTAERMRAIVRSAVAAQPSTELVATAEEGLRLTYRQTAREGISIVTIEIVDADDGASGVAVYSQSLADDRSADRDIVRRLIDTIERDAARPAGRHAG
jgi:hypothetical protein